MEMGYSLGYPVIKFNIGHEGEYLSNVMKTGDKLEIIQPIILVQTEWRGNGHLGLWLQMKTNIMGYPTFN